MRTDVKVLMEVASVGATFGFCGAVDVELRNHGLGVLRAANFDGILGCNRQTGDLQWPVGREFSPFRDLLAAFRLAWHIHCRRPSVVRLHTPKAALVGALATATTRTYTIFHLHGFLSDSEQRQVRLLGRISEWVTCTLADEIWPVARWMSKRPMSKGTASKMRLIAEGSATGVDVERRFNPSSYAKAVRNGLRRDLGIPSDAFVVGAVGRVGPEKGSRELVRVWSILNEISPGAYLLIVGDVEQRDRRDASIRALLSLQNVRITGWVADAAPYYSVMHVLLQLTKREGLPYALLEASAMEIPAVATNVPGCAEALEGAKSFGRLVSSSDVTGVSSAIIGYRNAPRRRMAEGKIARASICRRFAEEEVVKAQVARILDTFERLDCKTI